MSMSPPDYMTVQKIYAGWSFFGIAVAIARPFFSLLLRFSA
jgi:hypothetical protein